MGRHASTAVLHTDNLNLHIDLNQLLGEWIDLDQTRVHGAVKATELGDQTDVSLANRLVRVWAHDAARDRSAETDTRPQVVDCAQSVNREINRSDECGHTHRSIPAMGAGILALALQDLRIGRLQVLTSRRLHVDQAVDGLGRTVGRAAVGGTKSGGWRHGLAVI